MNYRYGFMVMTSLLLAIFFFTTVIYALSSTYSFLMAVLFFSFNPALLILGIGLVILGNFYPVHIVSKLIPFIGIVGINIPGVVAKKIFTGPNPETAVMYTGGGIGLSLFFATAIFMYVGLKSGSSPR